MIQKYFYFLEYQFIISYIFLILSIFLSLSIIFDTILFPPNQLIVRFLCLCCDTGTINPPTGIELNPLRFEILPPKWLDYRFMSQHPARLRLQFSNSVGKQRWPPAYLKKVSKILHITAG